jgi:hypothetical protein
MAPQAPERILDLHVPFVEAAEFEWSKIDVPDSVVDLLEAQVLADTHDADVDASAVPADAAIGADVADLEAIGYSNGGGRLGIDRVEGV